MCMQQRIVLFAIFQEIKKKTPPKWCGWINAFFHFILSTMGNSCKPFIVTVKRHLSENSVCITHIIFSSFFLLLLEKPKWVSYLFEYEEWSLLECEMCTWDERQRVVAIQYAKITERNHSSDIRIVYFQFEMATWLRQIVFHTRF